MKKSSSYSLKKFPASRIGTLDVLEMGQTKHHIKSLLELDVTLAREQLQRINLPGKKISFTAWLIKSVSDSLLDFPEIHAYLKNKRTVMTFEDIDVSIMVEKDRDGKKVPIVYVIRKTQQKSMEEITQEIEKAKASSHDAEKSSAGDHRLNRWAALYFRLPFLIRKLFWKGLLSRPKLAQSTMGSVLVSSVGMYASIRGWFIPTSVHPLAVGAGSIIPKPLVLNKEIVIREVLHLTLLMDHDVTDGGQMARFVKDFSQRIERAESLNQYN